MGSGLWLMLTNTRAEELATKTDIELLKQDIELKIETTKAETTKWLIGLLLAQAALIVALVKLL